MSHGLRSFRLAPLLLLALGGCGAFQSPKAGISVAVDAPARVRAGEPFQLRATITNGSEREALLDSIDIGDTYLEGVTLESSQPAWNETMHVPIDDTLSHDFQAKIAPGKSLTVTFTAVAAEVGEYEGAFDICVNSVYDCFFEEVATTVE